MDNEDENIFSYTGNVIKQHRKLRNIIESIIEIIIFLAIMRQIRFTSLATLFFSMVFIPAIIFVNMKGVKGLALTKALVYEIRYRRNCRKLHLWSPEYCRKEAKINELAEKNSAQYFVERAKKWVNRFVEKYSSDSDGKWN